MVNLLPLTVPEVEPISDVKAHFFAQLHAENPSTNRETDIIALAERQMGKATARPQHGRRKTWSIGLLAAAAMLLFALLGGMAAWNISLQQQLAKQPTKPAHTITYALQSTNSASGAKGELTCNQTEKVCTLSMHGLAPLTGNQVYQGWLLQGKQPTSVGLLSLQKGEASLKFQGTAADYDKAAVSLEPGPQASKDAPQGEVIALGTLK